MFAPCSLPAAATEEVYDVLVYSAKGVGAAVASAGQGRHAVKVMDPRTMFGGMAAANGLVLMNQGGCGLTGLSRNWSMLCEEYYTIDERVPDGRLEAAAVGCQDLRVHRLSRHGRHPPNHRHMGVRQGIRPLQLAASARSHSCITTTRTRW